MAVSVLCVVFGNLQEALGNLEELSNLDIVSEILVLENGDVGNPEEQFESIQHFFPSLQVGKIILFKNNHNYGFGPGVQHLIERAANEILLVINPDCKPIVKSIAEISDHISDCSCAIAFGAIQESDSLKLSGEPRFLPILSLSTLRSLPKLIEYLSIPYFRGALFFLKRSEILEVGGYSDYFLYFDELETTLRMKAKGKAVHFLNIQAGNHVGGSVTKISVNGFNPRMYYSAFYAVKFYLDHYRRFLCIILLNRFLKCASLVINGNFEYSKWVLLGTFDALVRRNPRGVN